MKLLTVAGDELVLRFFWPSAALHEGRQAARYVAERGAHVRAMRLGQESAPADGWLRPVRTMRRGPATYALSEVIGPLTADERALPEGALFVREQHTPMHNEVQPGRNAVRIAMRLRTNRPGGPERAQAIGRQFEKAIEAATGSPCNVELVDE